MRHRGRAAQQLGARDGRLSLVEEDDGTLRTLTPFQGVGSF